MTKGISLIITVLMIACLMVGCASDRVTTPNASSAPTVTETPGNSTIIDPNGNVTPMETAGATHTPGMTNMPDTTTSPNTTNVPDAANNEGRNTVVG